ncbi:hypothetical protein R50345_23335 [Paenibacillus sp. FSL R5-0345]|nr:hypothetical protein R50345_23335 [Paenibacillus sp. FSL R5-0345]
MHIVPLIPPNVADTPISGYPAGRGSLNPPTKGDLGDRKSFLKKNKCLKKVELEGKYGRKII